MTNVSSGTFVELSKLTSGVNCMLRLLKQVINEAAGERTPEAYPLGYVEDVVEMRTKLGACFSNRLR